MNITNSSGDNSIIEALVAIGLKGYMESYFSGNVTLSSYSNEFIEIIFNATNNRTIDVLTKNIATSMANAFRTDQPGQENILNGTSSTLRLAVKWQGLTVPILFTVSALILLTINIIRTHRSGVGGVEGVAACSSCL